MASRVTFKARYNVSGEYPLSGIKGDTEPPIDTLFHILDVRVPDNADNECSYGVTGFGESNSEKYGRSLWVKGYLDLDYDVDDDEIKNTLEYYLDPSDFGPPYNGKYLHLETCSGKAVYRKD